jgi:hypothetical protein
MDGPHYIVGAVTNFVDDLLSINNNAFQNMGYAPVGPLSGSGAAGVLEIF